MMRTKAMMDPHPAIFVLIPVYNEAGNILRLLEALSTFCRQLEKSFKIRVVLIDDGSRDQTSVLAKQSTGDLDLVILQHEKNLGPGRAFGTGFRYVAEHCTDDDLVLTMEGDNTSRIELIKQMLYRLEEGFDVILASPYLYGGRIENTSVYRIFLSSMANLFIKELLGIHGISTVSSFFRLYRARSLKRLQSHYGAEIIERNGFECMTEMVMKMVFLQMKISEIAMVLDTKARAGKSKMKIMKTIRGYFALWFMKKKWRAMSE
jgi:dolichol-phosphate mannosyltransferase